MTPTTPMRFAVDSNVIIYLFSGDVAKAERAERLMTGGNFRPVISTQVMNEVTLVMSRKMRLSWAEIERILEDVEVLCDVVPLTLDVHKEARRIAAYYGFRFYDSCILAFALLAGCELLYSEDMHHGQVILDKLTVINPFL
ncbi:PIN domain-containing protein [Chitinasiproducens palmae]|uniref:Ribonuclease VapC n=1 Tax=Chitinasiproducens palmae TaxID=1770053 RepID=A0A1H2PJH2_9BURK|nr:PIN domain-containing protein [Chitinasiproducens palmae]SDV46539.1 Predicted nucleic acid-binding protein, contains PIN domain [Chitinasiproducens palmae]